MTVLCFHEATVAEFFIKEKKLMLCLEDVDTGSSSNEVQIIVNNIFEILVDDLVENKGSIKMIYDDAEVLTLELFENGFFLLVEWNDFKNKQSLTKAYKILGDRLTVNRNKREQREREQRGHPC